MCSVWLWATHIDASMWSVGSRMPNANLRPQQSELLTANVDLLDNLYNTGLHFLAPPTEVAQKDVETDAKKEQFDDKAMPF